MNRLTILSLGWLLSFPVFALPAPPPVEITAIQWLPDSTVRVGNNINAVFRVSAQTGVTTDIWLHLACGTGEKTLLMMNIHSATRADIRVYGANSIARYVPGTPFEPDESSPFAARPELDLCRQNVPASQWVALATPDAQGNPQFIDVNRSSREGSLLKVRIATDYALAYRDEKYAAPYSVKIQDRIFDCTNNQSKEINSFSLDSQGRVTDSGAPTDITFSALSPAAAKNAQQLCAIDDIRHVTGSGTLEWREKAFAENQLTLPDFAQNDPAPMQRFALPNAVVGVVEQALASPQQHPAFRRLTYTQQWVGEANEFSVTRIDRQPDGTTLTLDTLTLGNVIFYSQYQRVFNIVDVKSWDSTSPAPVVSQTVESNVALPLKAGAAYQWRGSYSDAKSRGKQCHSDEQWHAASTISAQFTGRYLDVTCTDDRGDGRAMSSDYAYLEDLRIFLRIGYHDAGEKKRFIFKDVTLTY